MIKTKQGVFQKKRKKTKAKTLFERGCLFFFSHVERLHSPYQNLQQDLRKSKSEEKKRKFQKQTQTPPSRHTQHRQEFTRIKKNGKAKIIVSGLRSSCARQEVEETPKRRFSRDPSEKSIKSWKTFIIAMNVDDNNNNRKQG